MRVWAQGAVFGLTASTFTGLLGQPRIFYRMAVGARRTHTHTLCVCVCACVRMSVCVCACAAVINVCVLLFVTVVGATRISADNWTCVDNSYVPYGGARVFAGAGTVFFSFLGFDMVSSMAEEVKKPQRDLPIGIIGSLLISGDALLCVCVCVCV